MTALGHSPAPPRPRLLLDLDKVARGESGGIAEAMACGCRRRACGRG
jgi:hypothetical protein